MDNVDKTQIREMEDKLRCARFLLQMIEKYGASVQEKRQEFFVQKAEL